MAIKAVKMLDMKFHIPLKLNDLPTSDVVGVLTALLGSGRGPAQRTSLVPSEKCVGGWG